MKTKLITIVIIAFSLVGCSSIRMQWLGNGYFAKQKEKHQDLKRATYKNGNTKRIEKTKIWRLKNTLDAGIYSKERITTYYKNGKIEADSAVEKIVGVWDLNYPRHIKYKKFYINGKLKEEGNIRQSYTGEEVNKQSGTIKYYSENGKLEKVKEVK